MQYETLPLEAPAAVAAGASKPVQRHTYKAVYFTGTFDATLVVEICPTREPTTWVPAAVSSVVGANSPCVREFTTPCYHVRVRTTVYASGTPVCHFAGHDPV